MRKFLICDEKVNRQCQLLGDESLNAIRNNTNVILRNDITDIDLYIHSCEIIAIHSSLVGSVNDVSIFLNNYKTALENKYFILFSGSESEWRHESPHLLFLNVTDFYSPSLMPFISKVCDTNDEISLLEFHYGEKKQLPILIELKHKLWLNEIEPNDNFEELIDQACLQLGLNAYDPDLKYKIESLYNALIQQI